MNRINTGLKKIISLSMAVLLILILLASPFSQIVSAADPDSPFQAAPLNPAFIEYMKSQQSQMRSFKAVPSQNYGYIPPPFDLSHLSSSPVSDVGTFANAYSTEPLPASFDWRDEDKVTPVKDQGIAGTCWIFGSLASLESRIGIVEDQDYANLYDFSEQNLTLAVDPSYVQQAANRASGGDAFISTDTLTKWGTVLETTQPYNTLTLNTESCNKTPPPLQRVTDFRLITNSGIGSTNITNIKTAIQTYGPVIAAFMVEDGTMEPGDGHMYTGYVYDLPSYTMTQGSYTYYPANHEICIVGWNDTIPHPFTGGSGAWIIKNSWGTSYGNGGYFYLCYGSSNLQEVCSYHGIETDPGYKIYNPSEHLYYWDEAGMITAFGIGNNPVNDSSWMRSIFTAENAGLLTSVSFWTTSNNAEYDIYVKNNSETMLNTQSGTCNEMGYYSIPLDSPVALSGGQIFKIDVKMTTPGYAYPIAIEYVYPGYYNPPIQSGVCYFKLSDQDSWTDGATYQENGEDVPINVCLRATVTEVNDPIVSVGLQGRTEASASAVSLTVNFFTPSANLTGTPAYSFTDDVTRSVSTAVIQCTGIPSGIYDITAVSDHTLVNVKRNVPINALNTSVSLGTLLEGNANNDTKINIFDYGILFYSWNKSEGDQGYNAAADFNMDDTVDINDFNLLKANYGQISPILVP